MSSIIEDQIQPKRRRSSNQSITIQQPLQKKEKIHKKKLKKQLEPPKFELNLNSENERFPFKNFRDIILRLFNISQSKKPKWLEINNIEKIEKVVVCFCPGLEFKEKDITPKETISSIIKLQKIDEIPFIYDTFQNYIKTTNPGSKDSIHLAFQSIINIPLTKNEKKTLIESKQEKITIHDLLMTHSQLKENNYPIDDDSFQETIDRDETSKIYALDCEFCKSNHLQVLTRISLIDFNGSVIIDELVKPIEEITDYVTKYSGITEELLSEVETKIDDIQKLFLEKVSKNDILIGHSLESDLIVMKIKHEKIVDTSIIYEHNRGLPFKPSLRWLLEKYLNRRIQNGEDLGIGHSSIEDAKACLDLVKLKIIEGINFGRNLNDISIFSKLNNQNTGIKSLVTSYYKETSEENVEKIQVFNDDEVLENLKDNDSKFIVLNLKDLEMNLKWVNIDGYTGKIDSIKDALIRTNERLTEIYNSLPNNSLFILYTQLQSPLEMYKLQNIRRNFQKYEKEGKNLSELPKDEVWDSQKSDALIFETIKARDSLTFYRLKS